MSLSTNTEHTQSATKETELTGSYEIGESLSSLASSCLLSLVIAWGVTPKILQALDRLITIARPLAAQKIQVHFYFVKYPC